MSLTGGAALGSAGGGAPGSPADCGSGSIREPAPDYTPHCTPHCLTEPTVLTEQTEPRIATEQRGRGW